MPPRKKARLNTEHPERSIEKMKTPPKKRGKCKKKLQVESTKNKIIPKGSILKKKNVPESVEKKTIRPPKKVQFNTDIQERSIEKTETTPRIFLFKKRPQEVSIEKTKMPPKKKKCKTQLQERSIKKKTIRTGPIEKMTIRTGPIEKVAVVPESIEKLTNRPEPTKKKRIGQKKTVQFNTDLNQINIIPSRRESGIEIPHYDPIGVHLMALRTFYRGLVRYRSKQRKARKRLRKPSVPEYPIDYPTSSYLYSLRVKRSKAKQRPRLHFINQIEKSQIDQLRTMAIKRILVQVGYAVKEEDRTPLDHLSYVTDIFLKSFIERLRFHKDSVAFHGDDDLWNSLETTLQEWGFQGVRGIAKYFYDEFVQTTETLHDECMHMFQEVREQQKAKKKERRLQRKMKKPQTTQNINSNTAVIEGMEID